MLLHAGAGTRAEIYAEDEQWQPLVQDLKGKPVVAWHTSWRYFAEYTGVNIVAFMEPKPGAGGLIAGEYVARATCPLA